MMAARCKQQAGNVHGCRAVSNPLGWHAATEGRVDCKQRAASQVCDKRIVEVKHSLARTLDASPYHASCNAPCGHNTNCFRSHRARVRAADLSPGKSIVEPRSFTLQNMQTARVPTATTYSLHLIVIQLCMQLVDAKCMADGSCHRR